ncbi:MAG: hypothetical protein Q7O66_13795 [Dehalococcoidia bacterium]|nr:hypothetical protein [Dehalococcoidia bacterium]
MRTINIELTKEQARELIELIDWWGLRQRRAASYRSATYREEKAERVISSLLPQRRILQEALDRERLVPGL